MQIEEELAVIDAAIAGALEGPAWTHSDEFCPVYSDDNVIIKNGLCTACGAAITEENLDGK